MLRPEALLPPVRCPAANARADTPAAARGPSWMPRPPPLTVCARAGLCKSRHGSVRGFPAHRLLSASPARVPLPLGVGLACVVRMGLRACACRPGPRAGQMSRSQPVFACSNNLVLSCRAHLMAGPLGGTAFRSTAPTPGAPDTCVRSERQLSNTPNLPECRNHRLARITRARALRLSAAGLGQLLGQLMGPGLRPPALGAAAPRRPGWLVDTAGKLDVRPGPRRALPRPNPAAPRALNPGAAARRFPPDPFHRISFVSLFWSRQRRQRSADSAMALPRPPRRRIRPRAGRGRALLRRQRGGAPTPRRRRHPATQHAVLLFFLLARESRSRPTQEPRGRATPAPAQVFRAEVGPIVTGEPADVADGKPAAGEGSGKGTGGGAPDGAGTSADGAAAGGGAKSKDV